MQNIVSGRCLCNPSHWYWKEFSLSALSTSQVFYMYDIMSGKAGAISTTMVVFLALVTIMKDQIKQLKKVRVAETAIGIDEKAVKNWRVRGCV